jgi:hypothetical protein
LVTPLSRLNEELDFDNLCPLEKLLLDDSKRLLLLNIVVVPVGCHGTCSVRKQTTKTQHRGRRRKKLQSPEYSRGKKRRLIVMTEDVDVAAQKKLTKGANKTSGQ